MTKKSTLEIDFNKFDRFNHMTVPTVSKQGMTSLEPNENGSSYETSMNELEFQMGTVGQEMKGLVIRENEKSNYSVERSKVITDDRYIY